MAKLQRVTQSDVTDFGFKFCTWDIETSGLNASFGHLLCASIKPMNKKTELFRLDDFPLYKKEPWNDRSLVCAVRDRLADFDFAISYNGEHFDIPFTNSRLIKYHANVLSPNIKHIDLYKLVRYKMRLGRSSLYALLQHIDSKHHKTPLEPETWNKAVAGDKQSLDYIAQHNVMDVITLEEAFHKLIPLMQVQFRYWR